MTSPHKCDVRPSVAIPSRVRYAFQALSGICPMAAFTAQSWSAVMVNVQCRSQQ